jgi:hypothetical protein
MPRASCWSRPGSATIFDAGSARSGPRLTTAPNRPAPQLWTVNGLTRETALVISKVDGRPAYGGSPNDASLIRAIQDLKTRGLKVTLLPFIMMDIAAGNALANPWSDNASTIGQPLYPWRGRITGSPAVGYAGSVDKTAAATVQVAAFLGTAAPRVISPDPARRSPIRVRWNGPIAVSSCTMRGWRNWPAASTAS